MASEKYSQKLKLATDGERKKYYQALQGLSNIQWDEKKEQNCQFRLDGTQGAHWVRIKQFTNGTLYIEASTEDVMQNVLAPLSGKSNIPASTLTSSANKPSRNISTSEAITRDPLTGKSTGKVNLTGSYIGTDESGKGDYFGPLVIAGVFVNDDTCAALLKAGVMDSKKLTDRQIIGLAQAIHQIVGQEGICVVEMGPAKYNQLYDSFKQKGKNLNHLLAWGHARAIENLLTNNPSCTQAIADQFGSEHYIKSMLQEKGKQITLHQTPRAEANIGVAAASVIARYRFVQRLQKLSDQFQITLPLGAGSQVPITAKKFIQSHGKDKLGEVAKLHFKTTLAL